MTAVPVLPYRDALLRHNRDIDIGGSHLTRDQIEVCQGDGDASREIECTLYRYGEPWSPPEGTSVRIFYETPVGGKSHYEVTELGHRAWKIVGNKLTFAICSRVCNYIGVNKVYPELNYNGLKILFPVIEVKVCPDLHAREPKFYQDEFVGDVYFALNGVNSETDPFEVWYPVYREHQQLMEQLLDEGSMMGTEPITIVIEPEELPEQEVIGSGSLVDPIHYDGNQYLVRGLHYLQDRTIYKCVLGTRVPAYYKLEQLLGLYVEQAKVIPADGPSGTRNDPIQFVETTVLERGKFYVYKGALYLALHTTSTHPSNIWSFTMPVADLEDLLNGK